MKYKTLFFLVLSLSIFPAYLFAANNNGPAPFVMQLTRTAENYGHRRALMQLDKSLSELGEKNIKVEVIAYEEGIHALLSDNELTSQLVLKLASRGVTFKVCRISMLSEGLEEDDFPMDVGFVHAGAPEIMRLQIAGYNYLRP